MADFNPWGKSIFSARDPKDPQAPSLPSRKEGDTRSGWGALFDKSYPPQGEPKGSHEGSQSTSPNKEQP